MSERGPRFTWQYLAFWDDRGEIELERTRAHLAGTEYLAGMSIREERRGELHYVPGDGQWYIWDGRCHQPDTDNSIGKLVIEWGRRVLEMLRFARGVIAALVHRDLQGGDRPPAEETLRREFKTRWEGGGWDAASKFANGLMKNAGKNSLVSYMEDLCGTPGEVFEQGGPGASGLLCCSNGTVDLATGEIRRHQPADMLTYCLDIPYKREKAAEATGFWGMLNRLCADAESAGYLLRLLGYGLLGDNREQKVVFINGPTGSGKSKMLWILGKILGETLVKESTADLICHVRHGRNARVENSVRGGRFIAITETSTQMKIDEGQLKRITGEPVISVDEHYAKRKIRTPVSWLIVVATNEMPSIANYDGALRRRIIVVPGGPTLAAHEVDERIAERIISTESEAILAMLVASCRTYFRDGLRAVPLSVAQATEAYATEQDTADAFVKECCELANGESGWEISAQKMWRAYELWSHGQAYLGRNTFYKQMEARGMHYDKARKRFQGVRLTPEWQSAVL